MNNVRALLDQFWVTRLENRDLYFTLKRPSRNTADWSVSCWAGI